MAIDMTFTDFVTPIPADWLNNVNAYVNRFGTSTVTSVSTVAAIRSLSKLSFTVVIASGYYSASDGGGGVYIYNSADTTSADNGGTIIVASDGGRWYLQYSNSVSVKQFGARGNGTADDTTAIQNAINSLTSGGSLFFPSGTYAISGVDVAPIQGANADVLLYGNGISSIIVPNATTTSLFNITGKNVTVQQFLFQNSGTLATNGIVFNTDPSDAGYSGRIERNMFIGFNAAGISASGQNYDINNNFFQNNNQHILFTNDGRNTGIVDNYFLGGNLGIHLAATTQEAEGTRILNNTILITGSNGAGIQIDAGLEIYIAFNIIDQSGTNTPAVYMNPVSPHAISKVRMVSNWLAAGENSYSVFVAGNAPTYIDLVENTIITSNSVPALAGISMSGVNGYSIISNTFQIVSGTDLSISGGSVNGTIFGNTSTQDGSNAVTSVTSQPFIMESSLTVASLEMPTTGGMSITTGTGAPSASANQGSVYFRQDGGVGNHIYVCNGGTTWNAVSGV